MKNRILFISDSSITNPVLQSQGLPLMKRLLNDFNFYFITFEREKEYKKNQEFLTQIKNDGYNFINFFQIKIKKYKIIPQWISYYIYGFIEIVKIIKKNKIDILHARSLPPAVLCMLVKIFLFSRISFIYDNRGVVIDELILMGQWKAESFRVKIFRNLERKVLKRADSIIVVSNYFKGFLLKKFNNIHGLESKIDVIPNRTIIKSNNESEIISKKINEKTICVYSGSAAVWQNIPKLINFIHIAVQTYSNIIFKIYTYEKKLLEQYLIDSIDLCRLTIIEASPKEVYHKLSEANFGLLIRDNNLINNVASPLKFAEYLAAGVPIMISEGVGDSEEIIKKYEIGTIIKNDNYLLALKEMMNLLKDKDIYFRCLTAAKENFDINISFGQYQFLYNECISKNKTKV